MSIFFGATPEEQNQNRKTEGGKARSRAELWDQMHLFFQQYNDHQLHCVLYFSGLLDFDCIKKAVLMTMRILPELSSRYVEGRGRPYWEKIDPIADEIVTLADTDSTQGEIDSFLTGETDTFKGPQLRVRVVRSAEKDALCILMNHMICDGAGFKEYLYLLARVYTQVKKDPAFEPACKAVGSRSTGQIVRQISLPDKIKAWFMPNAQPKQNSQLAFPLSGDAGAAPYILTYKLNCEQFLKLKQYGKKQAATMNDVVLAAFIRALFKTVDVKNGARITVPCIMDLRRYLPDKKAEAICNLTSTILCDVEFKSGESFDETVAKVKRVMDKQKSQYPGLKALLLLELVFKLFPYRTAKKLIGRYFVNPLISLSNIGIIDENRLVFDTMQPEDAFITGAIKYYPYFLLALSSFRDSITFTVGLRGTEKDRRRVEGFFGLLEHEFKNEMIL